MNAAVCRATSCGVVAERPGADHRVARVDGDVGTGCEVQRDAQIGEQIADLVADLLGQRDVVGSAESRGAWEPGAGGRIQSGDVPCLLVDGDHDVGASVAKCGGQCEHLLRRADVAGKQAYPAERAGYPTQQPLRRGHPVEARHQHPVGQRADLLDIRVRAWCPDVQHGRCHPFTAPAVSPVATLRWMSANMITIGSATRVDAAISAPQSTPLVVMKVSSQTVTVCLVFCLSRT